MMNIVILGLLTVFVIILAILVFLRTRVEKFEIKVTDLAIAIFPLIIYLFATDQIQKVEIGGIKFEKVFEQAALVSISDQVTSVRELIEPVRTQQESIITKGDISLKDIIERRTEGLKFYLARERYSPEAINYYLNELSQYPFFYYVVLEKSDGLFFGLTNAKEFIALTSTSTNKRLPPIIPLKTFVHLVEDYNEAKLRELPGFVFYEDAVDEKMDKMSVLKRMERLDVDTLPVVNRNGRFQGVINRSKITASFLIDVGQTLKLD